MSDWIPSKAQQAKDTADATEQHFWTDADGAHISSTGDHDTSGFHQLLTSVKNAFMQGTSEVATFGQSLIELGKNSTSAVIKMCAGTFSITKTTGTGVGDYASIKSDSQMILSVPAGDPIVLTTYDTSGQTSDNGIGMIGNDAVIHCANVETNSKTIPASTFETALMPDVLYNGGAALAYSTAPGAGTSGTITASANFSNYNLLKVFFTDNNANDAGSVNITHPHNSQTVGISAVEAANSANTATYIRRTRYTISGNTLTPSNGGYVQLSSSVGINYSNDGVNYIKIVRIEGEK